WCSAMSLELRHRQVDFGFDAGLDTRGERFRPPLVTGIRSSACVSRGRHGPLSVVECALFFCQPGSSSSSAAPSVAQLAAQRTPAGFSGNGVRIPCAYAPQIALQSVLRGLAEAHEREAPIGLAAGPGERALILALNRSARAMGTAV